ncbi:hypothetical protein EYF80_036503 [Liparis tanakae]|uniref:Uncharacterized protein n=1 Tax=Liparis tanakae TaxID=230148 RepID=A0A4Z2GIU5_9TELE|nr:hypothetical protein EYF80_036503 [Liparis tanakae]
MVPLQTGGREKLRRLPMTASIVCEGSNSDIQKERMRMRKLSEVQTLGDVLQRQWRDRRWGLSHESDLSSHSLLFAKKTFLIICTPLTMGKACSSRHLSTHHEEEGDAPPGASWVILRGRKRCDVERMAAGPFVIYCSLSPFAP